MAGVTARLTVTTVVGLIALGFAISPVRAGVIVDPDAFPAGTNISNAFPGVTLSTRDGVAPGTNSRAVFSQTDARATTGTRAFAHDSLDTSWGNGVFEFLRADFPVFATLVSLDFFANDTSDHNPQLLAFDSGNNQVAIAGAGLVPLGSFVRLTVSAPNIAYIAAYWDQTTRADNGGLDRLEYVLVPEPSGLALVAAALVLGPALRRRR